MVATINSDSYAKCASHLLMANSENKSMHHTISREQTRATWWPTFNFRQWCCCYQFWYIFDTSSTVLLWI